MTTLADPSARQRLRHRIEGLTADAPRQWGSMTAPQMICHLTDSFRLTTGEKGASAVHNWFMRSVVKFVALNVPMTWPKGVRTRPEMDQKVGGTPPTQFEEDKTLLLSYFDRFCCEPRQFPTLAHPLFGKMKDKEWDRWAYLHVDHHLRQFCK